MLKVSYIQSVLLVCSNQQKKNHEIFVRISALAFKRKSYQKRSPRVRIRSSNYWYELPLFFFDLFFRDYGRNPYKIVVGFLDNLKIPRGHYEIDSPLKSRLEF